MKRKNKWNIVLTGEATEYSLGLENLLHSCPLEGELNCEVEVKSHTIGDDSLFCLTYENSKAIISCREKSGFFHALLCLAEQYGKKDSFKIIRKDRFSSMQAMIDLSRNAVYTVPELKRFLCRIALLGYNGCLLYMEDTYQIPEYPMFGYLRGSYSQKELMELDNFADSLGIELIPCVQTLAHLRTALRWQAMESLRDTADNMLVGKEETYQFIDAMLKELSGIFKSRRIHVGMDEAMTLGCGNYLKTHDYTPPKQLMHEHIIRVMELVDKYGLKPMMWDDMLFRTPGGGNYYAGTLDDEMFAKLPKGMQYVYWDYYHENPAHYNKQLDMRKNMSPIFAGGIWKWTGYTTHYAKTWATTLSALDACETYGVKEVMAAMWGDDSAETPLATILPCLALYGEARFGKPEDEAIDNHCQILSGVKLEDYFAIEELELLPEYSGDNFETSCPSKQILYSDLLSGLFDWHYGKKEVSDHYAACENRMAEAAQNLPDGNEMKQIFEMYACMAKLLSQKCLIGPELRKAYNDSDKITMQEINCHINSLVPLIESFHESIASIWRRSCKGQGLEVLDTRLGGLAGRVKSVTRQIQAYIDGNLENLDELEQEILPYNGITKGRLPNTFYNETVTANNFVYVWLF